VYSTRFGAFHLKWTVSCGGKRQEEAEPQPGDCRRTRKAVASGQRKADFSEFVGKWIPDPAFDELMAAQRRIDAEKWK